MNEWMNGFIGIKPTGTQRLKNTVSKQIDYITYKIRLGLHHIQNKTYKHKINIQLEWKA